MNISEDDPAEMLIHAPAVYAPRTLRFDPPLNDRELLRFCELNDIFRIERTQDGSIAMRPLPGLGASGANVAINGQLHAWCDLHKRGHCLTHAGYCLPDGSMRGPATSYLTEETAALIPGNEWDGFAHICPDFAVELMGYGDTLPEAKQTMAHWMKNGLKLGWLFDPEARRVFVFEAGSLEPIEVAGPTLEGSGAVHGFQLDLEEVWDRYQR